MTQAEVAAGLEELEGFSGPLVIEELLEGPEVSVFALCDGVSARGASRGAGLQARLRRRPRPEHRRHGLVRTRSRLRRRAQVEELVDLTCRPVLAELAARGQPFVGTLFAGLMLTADGPRVLEYNCRFGDPETQSLMPLVDGDLLAVLAAAAAGDLERVALGRSGGAAVTVVLAGGDYPASGDRGSPIAGIEAAEEAGALVFHAGTALRDGAVVTNGGRILNVTGRRRPRGRARAAYAAADLISWDGVRRREDIALAASVRGACSAEARLLRRSARSSRGRSGCAGPRSRMTFVIARYSRPAMSLIWSEEEKLRRWLDVELAALEGWAEVGLVPHDAVDAIRARAVAPTPERVAEIERETNHDVAAFVDAVSDGLGEEGRWFHYGLTSSDVLDTALSLAVQDAGALVLEGARPCVRRRRHACGGAPADDLHGSHPRCPCRAHHVRAQARRLGVRARS